MLNTTAGRKKAPEPWPIAAVADAVVTTDDSWVIRSWNRPDGGALRLGRGHRRRT